MDGQIWPSNVTLHKIIQNSFISKQKQITNVSRLFLALTFLHTLYELTPFTCSLVL
jgi:hypothetical protein